MISLKKGLTLRYVEAFTVQFTNSDWLWDRKMFQLYWKYLNYPPYIFSIAHPGFFLLGFASPDCATYEPPKAQTSKKFIKTLSRSVWLAGGVNLLIWKTSKLMRKQSIFVQRVNSKPRTDSLNMKNQQKIMIFFMIRGFFVSGANWHWLWWSRIPSRSETAATCDKRAKATRKTPTTLFYSNSYLYYYVNDVGLVF